MATLPPPHQPGRYRAAFICSGNICRSPSADVVARHLIADSGVDTVDVASGGMGDWHVGDPMDSRSAAILTSRAYDPSSHRAQQVRADWFTTYDVLLAMDEGHRTALRRMAPAGEEHRIVLFGDFDPDNPGAEVPDPYYGENDGFEEVLDMVERTCARLVPALVEASRQDPAGTPGR